MHAFRLHDGLVLDGARAWGPGTGPAPARVARTRSSSGGRYTLKWHDYSSLSGSRGRFRYLPIVVRSDRLARSRTNTGTDQRCDLARASAEGQAFGVGASIRTARFVAATEA